MSSGRPLRVLVVDDTLVYRMMMSEILSELENIEVVGTANTGKMALLKIALLKPDLLSLDMEMPDMNGLQVLEVMKENFPDVGAVMISAVTDKGGEMTMKALELGAFDVVPKPTGKSMAENRQAIKEAIAPMVLGFARRREIRNILQNGPVRSHLQTLKERIGNAEEVVERMKTLSDKRLAKSAAVAIGISTGGPKALARLLPLLPAGLGVPVFIAQHMPPIFTKALAKKLDRECVLKVKEAQHKEPVLADTVYIAPGGKQMKVSKSGSNGAMIRITEDPPENSCRPSADYLFRSIAAVYGAHSTGVIMTGMGADGVHGLKLIKEIGGTVIAQDESTCVVYGMPKEAARAGVVDIVAPLNRIADEIIKTVRHG